VDDLAGLADVCAEEQLWFHVDAAYGGFGALVPHRAPSLQGIERADSVVLDPHKWLYVPFECGCLLARDPATLKSAFHIMPDYLKDVQPGHEEVNFADYGEQLTRYARARKVWRSVRYYGLARLRAAIERVIELAEHAERLVQAEPSMEVLSPAQLGVLCFRVHPDGVDAPAELDALNERINLHVNEVGGYLISSTRVRGVFSLRVCTHSFRTSEQDIDDLIALIARQAGTTQPLTAR
jgi:glutamate/tyrosine decarboxylase-like PLP-dependent enzyme